MAIWPQSSVLIVSNTSNPYGNLFHDIYNAAGISVGNNDAFQG